MCHVFFYYLKIANILVKGCSLVVAANYTIAQHAKQLSQKHIEMLRAVSITHKGQLSTADMCMRVRVRVRVRVSLNELII